MTFLDLYLSVVGIALLSYLAIAAARYLAR